MSLKISFCWDCVYLACFVLFRGWSWDYCLHCNKFSIQFRQQMHKNNSRMEDNVLSIWAMNDLIPLKNSAKTSNGGHDLCLEWLSPARGYCLQKAEEWGIDSTANLVASDDWLQVKCGPVNVWGSEQLL